VASGSITIPKLTREPDGSAQVPIRSAQAVRAKFDPNKLSRFYSRLPSIATNGGIDVVMLGDSLEEGTGASNGALYSWGRYVGEQLQQWANRKWAPLIKGGLGFITSYTSSGVTNTTVVNTGTFTSSTPAKANGHVAFATCRFASGSGATVVLTTNWCTDIDLVIRKEAGTVRTLPYAITGTGSAQAVGANITCRVAAPVAPNWATNLPGWTTNGTGCLHKENIMLGATASATNTVVTVSNPSGDSVHVNGFIHYYGDRNAGLRYHRLGRSGWNLYASGGSSAMLRSGYDTVNMDELNFDNNIANKLDIHSNVDAWSWTSDTDVSTVGGTGRAALFTIEFLINDQSSYGNSTTPNTPEEGLVIFQAVLQKLVDRIISRPSKPCVLLKIPPAPQARLTNYRIMKQAVYNVANGTAHCAMMDFDAYLGETATRDTPTSWEADAAGAYIHYSASGYAALAQVEVSLIIEGAPA